MGSDSCPADREKGKHKADQADTGQDEEIGYIGRFTEGCGTGGMGGMGEGQKT